jgi:ankyrin repeat protein
MPLTSEQTQLVEAIKAGNIEQIKELTTSDNSNNTPKVNLNNFVDDNGFNAIHLAAQYNKPKIIRLIGKLFPNLIDAKTEKWLVDRGTPLHIAALNESLESIRTLIELGAKLEAIDDEQLQYTPLHMAIRYNKINATVLFLQLKANINTKNYRDKNPLDTLRDNKYLDLIKLLFKEHQDILEVFFRFNGSKSNYYSQMIKLALEADDFDLFCLIIIDYLPFGIDFNIATGRIKDLLQANLTEETLTALQELMKKKGSILNTLFPNQEKKNQVYLALFNLALEKDDVDLLKTLIEATWPSITSYLNAETYRDNDNNNVLHLASNKGAQACVEYLLSMRDRFSLDINAINNNGETALYIAVNKNNTELTKKLIDAGANIKEFVLNVAVNNRNLILINAIINKLHQSNNTIQGLYLDNVNRQRAYQALFELALAEANVEVLNNLFKENPTLISALYAEYLKQVEVYRSLLNIALAQDSAELFRHIIPNYLPQVTELAKATGQIKRLLDYKPARREKYRRNLVTLQECCTAPQRDQQKLQNMLYDQALTSDESSSDSENDEPQFLKPQAQDEPNILYRGFYLHPNYFKNVQERRYTRTNEYHQQTIYSYAVKKLAERLPRKFDNSLDYERANTLVKNYFELLKLTPDKKERNLSGRKYDRGTFDSLYYHFVMAYKNSYDQLVNEGGLVRNFNFISNDNPIVSTSEDATKSTEYAQRLIHSSQDKKPLKLRKTTGKFKHRRFGYLQVFAIDQDYIEKNSLNMRQLHDDGKIRISHYYKFDQEVFFESSIPAQHLLGYQVFSLPDLSQEWSNEIQLYFGLNRQDYNYYRNSFLNGNMMNLANLINVVTNYQANRLRGQVANNQRLVTVPSQLDNLPQPASPVSQPKHVLFANNSQTLVDNEIIGTNNEGKEIHFERHEIEGGLEGECGIIALPVANKKQLFDDLINALNNTKHPYHARLLELIGNDVMQLISVPQPDVKLQENIQEKLQEYSLIYQKNDNEVNRLKLQRACCNAEVCLSYIQDDVSQRNWISISILRAWATVNNVNLCIWQIQSGKRADILVEDIVNPTDTNIQDILYVNGNHFQFLLRKAEQLEDEDADVAAIRKGLEKTL